MDIVQNQYMIGSKFRNPNSSSLVVAIGRQHKAINDVSNSSICDKCT